jgi:hypothetical protein
VCSKNSKKSYVQNSNDFKVFSDGEAGCRVSFLFSCQPTIVNGQFFELPPSLGRMTCPADLGGSTSPAHMIHQFESAGRVSQDAHLRRQNERGEIAAHMIRQFESAGRVSQDAHLRRQNERGQIARLGVRHRFPFQAQAVSHTGISHGVNPHL